MDLIDKLKNVSEIISKQKENIETEEATKNAFIMPFLNTLGYDVFNPMEVVPEFTADVGTKKGEKVDYAIMIDGEPSILIECKDSNTDLDKEHAFQLYRYFSVTPARFGLLTNGIRYKFFTDIEKPNIMDDKPFFELDMSDFNETDVKELKKFTKSDYDLDRILTSASELKYTREMKKFLAKQIEDPSEDFVKFLAKQVYLGILTEKARLRFKGITKTALNQFIKEQVNNTLKSALEASDDKDEEPPEIEVEPPKKPTTIREEWEGYYIVKTIAHEITDPERVVIRDTLSYCGILLDDNNRKPICRLHFDVQKKYVFIFDEDKGEKVYIEKVTDLYDLADRIKNTIKNYDTS